MSMSVSTLMSTTVMGIMHVKTYWGVILVVTASQVGQETDVTVHWMSVCHHLASTMGRVLMTMTWMIGGVTVCQDI
jgi:hypothetical protein